MQAFSVNANHIDADDAKNEMEEKPVEGITL